MNILFCHDGPVNCDVNNRYYSFGFNDKLFRRYEEIFGNVKIITRVEKGKPADAYVEFDKLSTEKYPVVEYPNFLTLRGLFASKRESTKILEKEISKCDALVIRLPSFLGKKCVKLAKKYNKPFLVEVVGCPWDSLRNHGLSGKILAPYMCLATKAHVKKASDVLYVTNEFLQRRYPTKGRQIGCSDVELQHTDKEATCDPAERKTDPKKLVLGTVGKIDLKYKGHATVIKAMKILKAKGYDFRYEIVGPGDKSELERCAEENGVADHVVFVGAMGHDKIFEWLDTIDVYIQPSLTEGLPRALIEAMSTARPCVSSNAGGMPELLDKKYVFKKGNAPQLAEILLKASENGLLMQGERNKEFTKQYAPEVIKEKRTAFYQEFQKRVARHLQND